MKKMLMITAVAGFLFASCSKEHQIEKRLEKGDGVWNVAEIAWTKANVSTGVDVGTGVDKNAGTFTFNDDGTGNYDYTIDGQKRTGTFKWSNTHNTVTTDVNVTSALVNVVVYTIKESKKNEQLWNSVESFTNTGGTYNYTCSIQLTR